MFFSAPQQFHSKNGKAYLFNSVVNISAGPQEPRLMTTGMHTVRDIFCVGCMYSIGWKYVSIGPPPTMPIENFHAKTASPRCLKTKLGKQKIGERSPFVTRFGNRVWLVTRGPNEPAPLGSPLEALLDLHKSVRLKMDRVVVRRYSKRFCSVSLSRQPVVLKMSR